VEIAFAEGASTSGLPAMVWLCGSMLPARSEWPGSLQTDKSFAVRLDNDGLDIGANSVALPAGTLAAGSVKMGNNALALFTCEWDGTEDWYVPRNATIPAYQVKLLYSLHGADLTRMHTIDVAVAIGHLLGATSHGDTELEALQLGGALCGPVTWQAWYDEDYLRVRGRSDGGLLLPAVLLTLAKARGNGTIEPLPLRAFISRDGQRDEAVRQMSRGDRITDRDTLLAMLHGDDELRLTSIDSLVRLNATETLPRIIAAAAPSLPLTTLAATDAVKAMWHDATATTRERTRAALQTSPSLALRDLDLDAIQAAAPPPDISRPSLNTADLLFWLFVLFASLYALWLRERARLTSYA